MKKHIILLSSFLVLLWSCQSDDQYEDLNQDPKNPSEVSSNFLFTSATDKLAANMATPNVNESIYRFLGQYWTTTTYTDEPNYNLSSRNNPDNTWEELYTNVLYDLEDAKSYLANNTELSESEKNARMGQIEIVQVYAWHILVDTFGDIPYTQALQPNEYTLPEYDDAATIYEDLIARLTEANTMLAAGQGYSVADLIYGGDMDAWIKFSNSLKLRLGMRISQSNPTLSKSTVEAAVNDGIIASNSDNATVVFQSNPPNTNPLWEDLVQSGRADFLASNTLVDYMNTFNDPRRQFYFDQNLDSYIGGIYGTTNTYGSYTHVGELLKDPTREAILIDFTEVSFNLSQASKIGYSVPGDAETHYENAITASISYWGGSTDDIESYLSQPFVQYDGSTEQFATQFWISMYDNPFEGWSVWRKYDAPTLNIPVDFENPVPLRFTYPIDEQNLNNTNYTKASNAIGGDNTQTAIFWDTEIE
ncbi:SusD/RagB family nutrient-binding outer membrane lipoprotein [Zunongwangia sp.]|uniref:SusD/RagB family nutrient-binding outer membrane lipoprotein n=1 Tax=Zunongwangia sp. TaxID=1965325 RepID=UPI003AA9416F